MIDAETYRALAWLVFGIGGLFAAIFTWVEGALERREEDRKIEEYQKKNGGQIVRF